MSRSKQIFLAVLFAAALQFPVFAQVVQLPSIHTFSYSGSVLVPDSGGAYLGGVSRSASGRSGRRGIGGIASHSGTSISATIIDHQAIDRQLLAGSPQHVAATNDLARKTDRSEEGKALVRHARAMYRVGNTSASRMSYQMAIQLLDGQLEHLAQAEYERVFAR